MTASLPTLQLGLLRWFMEQESTARIIARCFPSTIAFQERKSIRFSIIYMKADLCFYDIDFGHSFLFWYWNENELLVLYLHKKSPNSYLFSFIRSSDKYLLSDYYFPGIIICTWDRPVNRLDVDKCYERQRLSGGLEIILCRSLIV